MNYDVSLSASLSVCLLNVYENISYYHFFPDVMRISLFFKFVSSTKISFNICQDIHYTFTDVVIKYH